MKKLFALLLAIALMATMSVTVFAEENETATITVEMADSAGDGWDDRARILALSVPSFSDMEEDEDLLGVFTLEGVASGTQTLTIGKNQTVYFFWLFDNEGVYNYEASFTIKRDGVTIYTHADETDECPLTAWQRLVVSEPIDPRFTTVTYSVAPAYTVTIPTDVTIDGNSTTISAEDVVVEKGQYVSVTLAADNNFTVKTAEGAELAYTVTANGENVAAGDEILAVNPADGKTGTATITFDIDESAIQYAGTYIGTATFTIAVKDAPITIINFTMDSIEFEEWIPGLTANLQAEAGMTWAEWIESDYNVDAYVVTEYWDGSYVICPEGEDWVAVRDTQIDGFDGIVLPTDEIVADNTYTLIQILG